MRSEKQKKENSPENGAPENQPEIRPVLSLLPRLPLQMSFFEDGRAAPTETLDIMLPFEETFAIDDGISVVQSTDGLSVEVSGYGARVGKKSERLTLKSSKGEILWQVPFERLNELFIRSSGISISADAIVQCAQRGIRVVIASSDARPQAILVSPAMTATVAIRRAQLLAESNQRGLELARRLAAGKILNQSYLLRYFTKNPSTNETENAAEIREISGSLLILRKEILSRKWKTLEDARPAIMGLEGTAARLYWDAVALLVSGRVTFEGRTTRGARDFVNSCLNYGYGILYGHVWGAVINAGLEPFAGFLHTDRSGKPSMVLDLIEPFRAPVVDRAVIAGIRLGRLAPDEKQHNLSEDTRTKLAEAVLARLDARETYKGGKYRVRSLVQMAARQAASFLTEHSNSFDTFHFKW